MSTETGECAWNQPLSGWVVNGQRLVNVLGISTEQVGSKWTTSAHATEWAKIKAGLRYGTLFSSSSGQKKKEQRTKQTESYFWCEQISGYLLIPLENGITFSFFFF